MTRLFLIRHAKPDYNIKDDFHRPLTQSGVSASEKIPSLFDEIKIYVFYSSPFIRAVNTIKPLAEKKGHDIFLKDNLCERKIGIWLEDFDEYAKKQWEDFDYKIENGESLTEVQQRNIKVIKEIIKNHINENVVIGTHGTALCTILNYYDKKFDFSFFNKIVNKTPYIIEMRFDNSTFIDTREIPIEL